MVALYPFNKSVDDCFMVGTKELIQEEMKELGKVFSIKHHEGIKRDGEKVFSSSSSPQPMTKEIEVISGVVIPSQ